MFTFETITHFTQEVVSEVAEVILVRQAHSSATLFVNLLRPLFFIESTGVKLGATPLKTPESGLPPKGGPWPSEPFGLILKRKELTSPFPFIIFIYIRVQFKLNFLRIFFLLFTIHTFIKYFKIYTPLTIRPHLGRHVNGYHKTVPLLCVAVTSFHENVAVVNPNIYNITRSL